MYCPALCVSWLPFPPCQACWSSGSSSCMARGSAPDASAPSSSTEQIHSHPSLHQLPLSPSPDLSFEHPILSLRGIVIYLIKLVTIVHQRLTGKLYLTPGLFCRSSVILFWMSISLQIIAKYECWKGNQKMSKAPLLCSWFFTDF